MDERTQGALLLAVGGIAIRLGATNAALAYVRPTMRPLLIVAGGFLVVIGLLTVVRAFRGRPDELDMHGHADHGHGNQPGHGPAVAWLLTLPLLALLLIAPPPLGAFAAGRQSDRPPAATGASFGPLPAPVDGAVELTLSEYTFRALYDEELSLEGQTVRLVGFVTPAPTRSSSEAVAPMSEEGVAFQLTRFTVACCAADGQAINVAVVGARPAPPPDTWLEVEGEWVPRPDHEVGELSLQPPLFEATEIREIPQPPQPYE